MNKKGSILIGLAVGMMIFISGFIFINFFFDEITTVRASDVLDCSNAAGISDGTKFTCLTIDLIIPYMTIIILSFAGGVIADKFAI